MWKRQYVTQKNARLFKYVSMVLKKATNHVEVYRARAEAADVHELSGRTYRKELTKFINQEIAQALHFKKSDCVVDVGCGDGSLLLNYAAEMGEGIGIVPTEEELERLKKENFPNATISFRQGLAQLTDVPTAWADKVICNGVLLLLENEVEVKKALAEIRRIAKTDALIWVGEMPSQDERAHLNVHHGNSVIKWLWWIRQHQGWKSFGAAIMKVGRSIFGHDLLILSIQEHYVTLPEDFVRLAAVYNLKISTYFKHRELDTQGQVVAASSRYDFIFTAV